MKDTYYYTCGHPMHMYITRRCPVSIKVDLYNIEKTKVGSCRSKRLAFSLQSNLGYEYETNMFSSLPIHSTSLDYDLDL